MKTPILCLRKMTINEGKEDLSIAVWLPLKGVNMYRYEYLVRTSFAWRRLRKTAASDSGLQFFCMSWSGVSLHPP